jgi:hypothetical protein
VCVPDAVERPAGFDDVAGLQCQQCEQCASQRRLRRVDDTVVVQYLDRTEKPNHRHRKSYGAGRAY